MAMALQKKISLKYSSPTCESDSDDDLKKDKFQSNVGEASSEYSDELFGISKPKTENKVSTTSSAQHHYEPSYMYDLFLVYDSEQDFYNAQDFLKEIESQDLSILDFCRDLPPGVPKGKFFTDGLRLCKYTCIIVTRNFANNLWIKFKTDMAIENMLEDERRQYSGRLVIVVMDSTLKCENLPLDIKTLSPICSSQRYFKIRLSKAFKGSPFDRHKVASAKQSSVSQSSYVNSPTMPYQSQDSGKKSPIRCTEEPHGRQEQPGSSDVAPDSFRPSVDFRSLLPKQSTGGSLNSSSSSSKSSTNDSLSSDLGKLSLSQESTHSSPYLEHQELSKFYTSIKSQIPPASASIEKSFTTSERLCDTTRSLPSSEKYSMDSLSSVDLYSSADSSTPDSLINFQQGSTSAPNTYISDSSSTSHKAESFNNFDTPESSFMKSPENSEITSNTYTTSHSRSSTPSPRTPREHNDTPPPSVIPSGCQRLMSVTVNSSGQRQPREVDESLGAKASLQTFNMRHQQLPTSCSELPTISQNNHHNENTALPFASSTCPLQTTTSENLPLPIVIVSEDENVSNGQTQISSVQSKTLSSSDSFEKFDVEISDEELPQPRIPSAKDVPTTSQSYKKVSSDSVKSLDTSSSTSGISTENRSISPVRLTERKLPSQSLGDTFDSVKTSLKETFSTFRGFHVVVEEVPCTHCYDRSLGFKNYTTRSRCNRYSAW